jgi:hypothetical protein
VSCAIPIPAAPDIPESLILAHDDVIVMRGSRWRAVNLEGHHSRWEQASESPQVQAASFRI